MKDIYTYNQTLELQRSRRKEIPMGDPNIARVFSLLQEREQGGKPLTSVIRERLDTLSKGIYTPIVVFTCVDFQWSTRGSQYPTVDVLPTGDAPIISFFQNEIIDLMQQLQTIGSTELIVVIPDSELVDERAFSFSQPIDERRNLGIQIKENIETNLAELLQAVPGRVVYWSDYCKENGIASPLSYTEQSYQRMRKDEKTQRKIRDYVKDSRKYFDRMNIDGKQISQEEMDTYMSWFLAMYAGEGEALADMNALVLMPEDRRVPAWFSRGAQLARKELAMIQPVNPLEYFTRRERMKGGDMV